MQHLRTLESIPLNRKTYRGKPFIVSELLVWWVSGSQKKRRPVLTKVMKEDVVEETEFEMDNIKLVRLEQARRANHSKHKQ